MSRYGYRRSESQEELRSYRAQGLMERKRKRANASGSPSGRLCRLPSGPNQSWSMDYVADALIDGSKLRVLAIVDDYSRECLRTRGGHVASRSARRGSA